MGNLKEIRTRISSIESTQKITSSMKLVSAAKLRRAQTNIQHLRPYSNKLNEILRNLTADEEAIKSLPLFQKRDANKIVLVVITSNKGLCGGFNSSVVKAVVKYIDEHYAEQAKHNNVKMICIGKKGHEQLSKWYPIMSIHDDLLDTRDFKSTAQVAENLMKGFLDGEIDRVEIIYNQFVNAATQRVTAERYLPVAKIQQNGNNVANLDYIIEPSPEEVLTELIPKILKIQLYKTLTDSIASEHGARMISMTKATDNANEILKELRLKYNNARQSSITNELIEIVSGAEALNN